MPDFSSQKIRKKKATLHVEINLFVKELDLQLTNDLILSFVKF